MKMPSRRFRRGQKSAERPGLVFFRYRGTKEVWVTPKRLAEIAALGRISDKKWKESPEGRAYMREYLREYMRQPEQKARQAAYYASPEVRARWKERYATDEEFREKQKARQKEEPAKISRKKSDKKNKAKIAIARRKRTKKKLATDPIFKLRVNCQKRISIALKCAGVRKTSRTAIMLGCSFEFFRGWIENQFTEGMNWDNYGNEPGCWNVDHEIPISRFRIEIESERNQAFNYRNCRPMWYEDNQAKSDYIEHEGKKVQARTLRTIIPFQTQAA